METFNLVQVGIADMKISKKGNILRTILGSCVGICLYDTGLKAGGLAHVMLPTANVANALAEKYVDTALPLLVKRMQNAGCDIKRMKAKIAGGAKMFDLLKDSSLASIGQNNTAKAEQVLYEMGIELVSKDVGGNYSRIISFDLSTGLVKIKASGIPDIIL